MGVFGGKRALTAKQRGSWFVSWRVRFIFVLFRSVIPGFLPPLFVSLQNGCAYVGCGESHTDHSTVHSQVRRVGSEMLINAEKQDRKGNL